MKQNNILYHGTILSIPEPLVHVGRSDLDFGPGFYVTNDKQQAIDWANTVAGRRANCPAILNVYHFNVNEFLSDNKYTRKHFPEYNIEWLDFIAKS